MLVDHLLQAKKEYKKKEAGDSRYIYQNNLNKACFEHERANGDFKDMPRTSAADEVLRDKAFNIAKNPKYDGNQCGFALSNIAKNAKSDGYQCEFASLVYILLDKKSSAMRLNKFAGSGVKIEIIGNQQLAEELGEELYKTTIKKIEK